MNISLLIGLRNNLDYTKYFYKTTRELYPEVELCFVSYGSTDETHNWLDSLDDSNVKYFYSDESKTFSDTFNKAAEIGTKKYMAFLHNDIVLTPNFIENILKHLTQQRVVSYTTIEPPIFGTHSRPGKIVREFGRDLESFDKDGLLLYAKQDLFKDQTQPGITFFMALCRETYLKIGGMDNLFNPMFCEDDDLIRRLGMYGLEQITSLDALCYHFVSKTSRFSPEYEKRTKEIESKSQRNFFRKWNNAHAINKYDIGFIVKKCNIDSLGILEPWCSNIYIEDDMQVLTTHYLDREQSNTAFDLSKRVKPFNSDRTNDILVTIDVENFYQEDFNTITMLGKILEDSGEVGKFKVHNLDIEIKDLKRYEQELIVCNTTY